MSPADEIDSFLSKRGDRQNEHEALRKMKNEFMSHWQVLGSWPEGLLMQAVAML